MQITIYKQTNPFLKIGIFGKTAKSDTFKPCLAGIDIRNIYIKMHDPLIIYRLYGRKW